MLDHLNNYARQAPAAASHFAGIGALETGTLLGGKRGAALYAFGCGGAAGFPSGFGGSAPAAGAPGNISPSGTAFRSAS